ncbi:hypothetical protein ACS0X5_26310 [Burkholderia gladioli]|uniref:hypothetical protein n=1 Tax=Burkholderia gladioli TaxID=28095 RepID=UPI0011D2A5E5|nr:hypothetical protein [Burkholderia gladioli]MBW5280842.1 hypothetical protein [Burkholderia gladioli]
MHGLLRSRSDWQRPFQNPFEQAIFNLPDRDSLDENSAWRRHGQEAESDAGPSRGHPRRGQATARRHHLARIRQRAHLPANAAPVPTPDPAIDPFTCAIANDGSLVLMRAGRIELALSDADTAILQRYLVKRIAANKLLSDMAG